MGFSCLATGGYQYNVGYWDVGLDEDAMVIAACNEWRFQITWKDQIVLKIQRKKLVLPDRIERRPHRLKPLISGLLGSRFVARTCSHFKDQTR